jgi:hypothetical protein
LIHDATNDESDPVPNNDAALDITSTSVSSTANMITVVLGLRKIDGEATPGYGWQFDFSFGGHYFFLLGTSLPGGADYNAYEASAGPEQSRSGVGIGQIEGIVDLRKSTVPFKAPSSIFTSYGLRKGTKLAGLYTSTWRANGASSESVTGTLGHVSASGGLVIDTAKTTKVHAFAVTRCQS